MDAKIEIDVISVDREKESGVAFKVILFAEGWETEWSWENERPFCFNKTNYGSNTTFVPEDVFDAMRRRARAILSEKR